MIHVDCTCADCIQQRWWTTRVREWHPRVIGAVVAAAMVDVAVDSSSWPVTLLYVLLGGGVATIVVVDILRGTHPP